MGKITAKDIITATTVVTGVDFAEIISKRRAVKIVQAREIIVLVARRRTTLGYPDIAVAMGRKARGHSTTIDQHRKALARDSEHERCNDFARLVDQVNDTISDAREGAML